MSFVKVAASIVIPTLQVVFEGGWLISFDFYQEKSKLICGFKNISLVLPIITSLKIYFFLKEGILQE